jgi:hypothetical protein
VKRHKLHMSLSQRGLPAAESGRLDVKDVFLQRERLALRHVVSIVMELDFGLLPPTGELGSACSGRY